MATTNREFKDPNDSRPRRPYYLLPFRFHPLSDTREVLVSEVGDWLVCPRGTATRVVLRQLDVAEPLYADLLASFIISEKRVPDLIDVIATRYRTKKSFLDSFTSLHIFVLTLRCNHSCHYCQVSRQTEDAASYDMSLANLGLAIDLMFRSPSPELTVEFQGGEPLLAFETLRFAVEEIERRNIVQKRKLTFVVCTNLSVLTEEILTFLARHSILVSTSLDGHASIHNANRPTRVGDSFEMFAKGLAKARTALGRDRVSALLTTSTIALEDPEGIVDSYVELGFSHIFLRPIQPYGFAARLRLSRRYESDRFLGFYKRALSYILELNRRGVHLVEDLAAIMLRKMLTPFPVGYVDLQSPAGAVTGVVVYNYEGGVYASDESRMLAEAGDEAFRLGSVGDSYEALFYGPKAREIVGKSVNESLAGCADCGFQVFCGADPVRHHAAQEDMEGHRPTSPFCATQMELFRWLFELIDTQEGVQRIFRKWTQPAN